LRSISGVKEQTPIVDGFTAEITSDTSVTIDFTQSGWINGNSNYIVQIGFDSRFQAAYQGKKIDYPADFEISFTGQGQGDLSFPATTFSQPIQSNIIINNITEGKDHFQFIFRDENRDQKFNDSDAIFFAFGDSLGKQASTNSDLRISWSVTLIKDTTIAEEDQRPPQVGDVFRVVNTKPFRNSEFYEFTTKGQGFDNAQAQAELKDMQSCPILM
jgi:hypothetical protein